MLKSSRQSQEPDADKIIWEHGRRNFVLRNEGRLCIVGPMTDRGDLADLYIYSTDAEETRKIMNEDPAVKAGVFTYDIHTMRSFPGDSLGKQPKI
jgi:uncharacterized protein YciI